MAYRKAIKSKLYTSAFIIKHNLSKLYIFIRNNYFGENNQYELINELKSIKLSSLAVKLKTKENTKIIDWISENHFYSESRDKIQSSVSKIIDNYYSSKNGGWSSNSEVWNLINEYAAVDGFLNSNYIIYDRFKEYSDLSHIFMEGLFASHAIKESNGSRLESFDDWIIKQLIVNCDAKIINKLFKRYELKSIKYEESESSGDTLNDLINNFFTEDTNLRETFGEKCEKDNRYFWDFYNRVFSNILTIVSICDFDSEFFNLFTQKLITYLESENFIHFSNLKYVKYFFIRKGKDIEEETLTRFFLLTINNSKYHKDDFFESLSSIFQDRKLKLVLNESQIKSIRNLAFEECEQCKEKHQNTIIIPFFEIIKDESFKNKITKSITQQLDNSFSFHLYYLATLLDIIDFKEKYFNKALDCTYPNSKRVSFKSIFSGVEDNRFDQFNDIVNLCFKFNKRTNDPKFKKFAELDEYYLWLLDMDAFDYKNFQPSWISEYPTKYYYRKIGTSKKVKHAMDKYLESNFDSKIEGAYLNIFIRRTWDKKN